MMPLPPSPNLKLPRAKPWPLPNGKASAYARLTQHQAKWIGQSTGVVRAHRVLVPACLERATKELLAVFGCLSHLQPWGSRGTRCSEPRANLHLVGPHDLLTPRDVLAAAVMHLSGGPVCACVRREVLRTFGPAFVAG